MILTRRSPKFILGIEESQHEINIFEDFKNIDWLGEVNNKNLMCVKIRYMPEFDFKSRINNIGYSEYLVKILNYSIDKNGIEKYDDIVFIGWLNQSGSLLGLKYMKKIVS